ncbi:MAG: D-amino-acid transaminase [Pseudomonadota bacterium]|nr:D-amino-acid transaminase [Pseudomonadota bacterium]
MSARWVYVDGRFAAYADARVHVEDRGLQFADSVYEVWAVLGGRLGDAERHFARLFRNLAELEIAAPMGRGALLAVLREAVRRNRVREGLVYVQVTRGAARREHLFPEPAAPTLVVVAKSVDRLKAEAKARAGVAVITRPDERWGRCDLKTTGLLPNVLAKQAAKAAGATEVWFVGRDGFITEGASTTAWLVEPGGALVTRPKGLEVLPGVTRDRLIELAGGQGLEVVERPFTPKEAAGASEVFYTAASAFVTPVVRLDGEPIGDGRPGAVVSRLRSLYLAEARNGAL